MYIIHTVFLFTDTALGSRGCGHRPSIARRECCATAVAAKRRAAGARGHHEAVVGVELPRASLAPPATPAHLRAAGGSRTRRSPSARQPRVGTINAQRLSPSSAVDPWPPRRVDPSPPRHACCCNAYASVSAAIVASPMCQPEQATPRRRASWRRPVQLLRRRVPAGGAKARRAAGDGRWVVSGGEEGIGVEPYGGAANDT